MLILMVENVFTAAEIAAALHRPRRSVLELLRQIPSGGTKIVHGNEARAWPKDALPQNIQAALGNAAARQSTTINALLTSPPPFWRPRYPLSQLCEEAIERASMLKRALGPPRARQNDAHVTAAEFEQLGVEDYRRAFGHRISTRHWRRLLKRTLDRDGGAKNWGRLEIYLDESPARKPESRKRTLHTSTAFWP